MYKRFILISTLSLFLFSCATPTPIQELQVVQTERRSITVSGTGEVAANPDLAEIVFSVYTTNKDLLMAKEENEKISSAIIQILKNHNINENDIKTNYLNVFPETPNTSPKIRQYGVRNNFEAIVRDLSKLEVIITDVLSSGDNSISGIYFQVSNLEEYKEEARTLAIEQAREKAIKMAEQLGQEINEPISIQEVTSFQDMYVAPVILSLPRNDYSNFNFTESSVSIGKIIIKANVSIEFSLK